MNRTTAAVLAGLALLTRLFGQVGPTTTDGSSPPATPPVATPGLQPVGPPGLGVYAITEAGPHQRRWSRVTQVQMPDSSSRAVTNSYLELATGLNRLNTNGKWVPAQASFEIINGAAVARNTAHHVILTSPTDPLPVDLLTPDGQRLSSRVLGLSYYSAASGKSVMIAQVKAAQGTLVATNQVLYEDCFDGGFQVDLRYTLTLAGLEQDVLIREAPPSPAEVGLQAADGDLRLEVLTEFLQAPQPAAQVNILRQQTDPALRASMVEPDFTDQTLWFGAMVMGPGVAFFPDASSSLDPSLRIRTAKDWQVIEQRTILFEAVELDEALPMLARLPARPQASVPARRKQVLVASRGELVPKPKISSSKSPIQVALNKPIKRGFTVDYNILAGSTNLTLKGNETYYASSSVNLFGTTTIEAGSVVKLLQNYGGLSAYGPISCATRPAQPAIFTSRDDDTVGEQISGSSGTPGIATNGTCLFIQNNWNTTLENLRVSYQNYGIYFFQSPGKVRHSQIAHCMGGVMSQYNSVACENLLVYGGNYAFSVTSGGSLSGANVTLDGTDAVVASGSVTLTNSLLVALSSYSGYSGSYNQTSSSSSSVFQTVGAGNHYLVANSAYRNAGTASIDFQLLSDLAQRTTYPPLLLTGDFNVDTVLSPQAQRNTGIPDLGYHYDPTDYCMSGLNVVNATLLLTNGVSIAAYGTNALVLQSGATLISEGTPTSLNRIARYPCLQELTRNTNWGASSTAMELIDVATPLTTMPSVSLRFTQIPALASAWYARHLFNTTSSNKMVFSAMDCQFLGTGIQFNLAGDSRASIVSLTNNLFERFSCELQQLANGCPLSVTLQNNLFTGGFLALANYTNTPAWAVYQNVIDNIDQGQYFSSGIPNGTNAYCNMSVTIPGSSGGDITLSNPPDYSYGPYGSYYYPRTGGNLSRLIDAGGCPAANVGLYHYTTTIDEIPEGTTSLDIGFHYAVSSPGPSDHLAGFWRLTDGVGSTAADSSGNGNNGTLINSPVWATGPPPHDGLYFNKTNYVDVPNPTNGVLNLGTGSFSFGMWVYVYQDPSQTWSPWYKGAYYSTGDPGFTMNLSTSGSWTANISDGTHNASVGIANGAYQEWVHLFAVVNRAANVMQLFVNGILQASTDISAVTGSCTSTLDAQIAPYIHGFVADMRVYSRVLSSTEVASVASEKPKDSNGNGVPDYLEDRNGNGTVDSGEMDWQNAADGGLKVLITEPKATSNVP